MQCKERKPRKANPGGSRNGVVHLQKRHLFFSLILSASCSAFLLLPCPLICSPPSSLPSVSLYLTGFSLSANFSIGWLPVSPEDKTLHDVPAGTLPATCFRISGPVRFRFLARNWTGSAAAFIASPTDGPFLISLQIHPSPIPIPSCLYVQLGGVERK